MTGIIFCHICGSPLEAGIKFCSQCGTEIGDTKYCRMCGKQLGTGDKFCASCGTRVLLIEKVAEPVAVEPPEDKYISSEREIALLPGEHILFPSKQVKIKFHKGYIRKWIIDPLVGIVIWALSAILIFLILDDGWNFLQYGTGKFADFVAGEGDIPSVFWFIGIGVVMFVLGWLWSVVSFLRGPPKVDFFATNQRLILRDEERTGFLTRAMLGVNIFMVLRNPLHIKKVYTTYRNLKHQVESSRDEMDYDYLILKKGTCVKNVKMKKITSFITALVSLVLAAFTILIPLLSAILFFSFFFSLLISIVGLFRAARPRISFRKGDCQGQLRYFLESTELDVIGLADVEEMTIMQTYG